MSQFTWQAIGFRTELRGRTLLIVLILALPLLRPGYSTFPWYFWDITVSISKRLIFLSGHTGQLHFPASLQLDGGLWFSFGQWSVGLSYASHFRVCCKIFCHLPCSLLPCLDDVEALSWDGETRNGSWHGEGLSWRIALHASDLVGARNKLELVLEQNFNVYMIHLKISFKCRFWFSKVWVGCEILHF